MKDGRWRISVTAPDWGQDHLSSEAIVAFVDGELARGPNLRAAQHLARCLECAAQVVSQGQARSALRAAECPSLPSSLLNSLRSIPQHADLPAPPPGLAMTADGQFVSVLRPERPARPTAARTELAAAAPPPGNGRQRRIRLGTGVAFSGLALGALAFGAPAASSAPEVPTGPDGAFGGSVLGGPSGVVEARLKLAPVGPGNGAPASRPDPVADPLPGSFGGVG